MNKLSVARSKRNRFSSKAKLAGRSRKAYYVVYMKNKRSITATFKGGYGTELPKKGIATISLKL